MPYCLNLLSMFDFFHSQTETVMGKQAFWVTDGPARSKPEFLSWSMKLKSEI